MSVGTANGIPFSLRDIEGIATAFDALGLSGRVPLKFGHNDDQALTDGQPALGWISRIYVDGDVLKGDFVDMPTSVYELIQSGNYKFISVELLKNVQAGTRTLPWVLDAVALLGADQPAFGNLKDLQSLTLKRKSVLQARARVAFRRDTKFFSTGAHKGMEKHEVDAAIAAALAAQEVKFTSQITALKNESAAALEAERANARKAEITRHRESIKAKFESAVQSEAIKPAVREQFYRLTRIDTDAVLDIKAEEADAFINEHADKTKLAAKLNTQQGQPDADEAGKSAADVVVMRAKKLCYSRNQDPKNFEHINAATVEVLKADKALGEAYKLLGAAPTKAA